MTDNSLSPGKSAQIIHSESPLRINRDVEVVIDDCEMVQQAQLTQSDDNYKFSLQPIEDVAPREIS